MAAITHRPGSVWPGTGSRVLAYPPRCLEWTCFIYRHTKAQPGDNRERAGQTPNHRMETPRFSQNRRSGSDVVSRFIHARSLGPAARRGGAGEGART